MKVSLLNGFPSNTNGMFRFSYCKKVTVNCIGNDRDICAVLLDNT